jgi:hypothetical protein
MTVCLAVLGKYVPILGFFATLLGEEAELDQNIRFYQRLVLPDQDGAAAIVEAALPRGVQVYSRRYSSLALDLAHVVLLR